MGVRKGELEPPLAGQNSMFFNFFEGNSNFFRIILRKEYVLPPPARPPLEKFAIPWKKSADAHGFESLPIYSQATF